MKVLGIAVFISLVLSLVNSFYPRAVERVKNATRNIVWSVEIPGASLVKNIQNAVETYIMLVDVTRENRLLKTQIAQLKIENKMLTEELKFIRHPSGEQIPDLIPARFGIKNYSNPFYLYITTTKPLPLKNKKCVVVSRQLNLIGSIESKLHNGYLVKTVFNSNFVADVYIQQHSKVFRALFVGSGDGGEAKFFDPSAPVSPGESIYTSGEFHKYPSGIKIGTIKKVKSVDGLYKIAYIHMSKSFFNDFTLYVECKQ